MTLHFITQLMDIYTSTCIEWGLGLRSSNDSEILALLPFDHDNVVFYSYLIMLSSALYKVLNSLYLVHVSSKFEFCNMRGRGGAYMFLKHFLFFFYLLSVLNHIFDLEKIIKKLMSFQHQSEDAEKKANW